MNIAIFGLGYVGSVSAACLAAAGHTVIGVDVDPHKLALLRKGRAPVTEPGLDELLERVVREGRPPRSRSSASARRAGATEASIRTISNGSSKGSASRWLARRSTTSSPCGARFVHQRKDNSPVPLSGVRVASDPGVHVSVG